MLRRRGLLIGLRRGVLRAILSPSLGSCRRLLIGPFTLIARRLGLIWPYLLSIKDDARLRAEPFVVDVVHSFDHMYGIGAEVQVIVRLRVRRKPVLAID